MVVATNSSCVFCKIIAGNLPASQLYSDELCIAFLDLHPINPGHVLVVPNRHVERCFDLTKEESGRLFGVAQEIYRAIRKTDLQCEGANLFLSDGTVAGQEVPHSHLHIAPRFTADGHRMGFSHADPEASARTALDSVAAQIKAQLR
jgi:histidine triad (HIT) family protein